MASAQSAPHGWRNTILAGLANYIDAGSIVSGSAALSLWVDYYKLSPGFVGILGAFSANAISAGIGALIGGRLCDRFGRKTVYQYDMFLYAFGMLFLVFATQPWMILTGFVIVGLAVGADIPASWSLIAETAPRDARGKHSGVAQVLWYLGPVVVLLLSQALAPLGLLAGRIVFAHLFVIAVVLIFLRTRMRESMIWTEARNQNGAHSNLGELFTGRNIKTMAFLIGMYGIWNLWAGTVGFFFPYILHTVGAQTTSSAVLIQAFYFGVTMLSVGFIFMRYVDRVNQRLLLCAASLVQVIGMMCLAIFPLTVPVALLYATLTALGAGFGQQCFFQLWSAEMFPTLLRGTAQGFTFAVVRIGLGLWSFVVPYLAATGFTALAWIMTGFLVVSGVIAFFGAPSRKGQAPPLTA